MRINSHIKTFLQAIYVVALCLLYPTVIRSVDNQMAPVEEKKNSLRRSDHRGVEQVWVAAGVFFMGTAQEDIMGIEIPPWATIELPAEMPRHEVRISKGFWIDRCETTNRNSGLSWMTRGIKHGKTGRKKAGHGYKGKLPAHYP